ncbi:monocarboxylate transporter 14-like [Pomacea canaliculata]|uniref:monocarboxylate transporter 14-like n=1 Tax=Pomacea canaliculata TaxID=400727 RepID=UPI000D73DD45|nr:monocarboxylate transporter 14-like [Pomacea canaliculata]XP_025079307.1 monocarboxylate transporter 14-like [Pomacea canaliculata]
MAKFLEVMNFSLMRNWMFRLILTYQTLGFTIGFVGLYFPSLAVRNGLSREEAALLISVIGGVDLFSKLTSGLVADLGCIRRTHLVAIALVITSVACHFTRFYTTFATLALFAVVFGLFAGVCPNLSTVVIIDLLGLEHLGKSMGLFLVVNSIFTTANHPLIGALVETTGSMILPFHYIGVCVFLGAILLLLEPCARRLEERRVRVEMARTSI